MSTPATPAPPAALPPVPQQDPEVARLSGEVARYKTDLEQLKRQVTAPPQPAVQPGQQMSSADMAREFYKDPVGHAVAIANKVVADRLQEQGQPGHETLVQVARDSIRNRSEADKKLFDKYILEIEATVSTVAPQFRGNINVWENAFKMVKGNHIDEIIAERQPPPQSTAIHVREGGGPEPPSSRPAQAPSGTELSQDEKRTAKRLGLTEDQYKAGKAHLEGQNDPITDPVGKSSWDAQITFDSRERTRRLRAEAKARQGGK